MEEIISNITYFRNYWFWRRETSWISITKKTFWEQFTDLVSQISSKWRTYSTIQDINDIAQQKWLLEKELDNMSNTKKIMEDISKVLNQRITNYKLIWVKLEQLEETVKSWIL